MTEDQKSLEEVTKKLKNRGGGRKRVAKPLNVADLDLEKMGPDARKQIEAALTDTDKTTVKKDDEVLVVDKPNKRVKRGRAREFVEQTNKEQRQRDTTAKSGGLTSRVAAYGVEKLAERFESKHPFLSGLIDAAFKTDENKLNREDSLLAVDRSKKKIKKVKVPAGEDQAEAIDQKQQKGLTSRLVNFGVTRAADRFSNAAPLLSGLIDVIFAEKKRQPEAENKQITTMANVAEETSSMKESLTSLLDANRKTLHLLEELKESLKDISGGEKGGGKGGGNSLLDNLLSLLVLTGAGGLGRGLLSGARGLGSSLLEGAGGLGRGLLTGARGLGGLLETGGAGALILGGAYAAHQYNMQSEVARERLKDSQGQFEQENNELEALKKAYEEEQATLDAMGKDDPKRRQQEQMVAGFKQRLDELQASRDKLAAQRANQKELAMGQLPDPFSAQSQEIKTSEEAAEFIATYTDNEKKRAEWLERWNAMHQVGDIAKKRVESLMEHDPIFKNYKSDKLDNYLNTMEQVEVRNAIRSHYMTTNRSPAMFAELLHVADERVKIAGHQFVLGKNKSGEFRQGKGYIGGKEVTREDFMNRTVDEELGQQKQQQNQQSPAQPKPAPAAPAGPAATPAAPAKTPPATKVPPTPTSGPAVSNASKNRDMQSQPQQAPRINMSQPAPNTPGHTAPTHVIDPHEPGPVEPADAAERYSKLFGID